MSDFTQTHKLQSRFLSSQSLGQAQLSRIGLGDRFVPTTKSERGLHQLKLIFINNNFIAKLIDGSKSCKYILVARCPVLMFCLANEKLS